MKKYTDPKLNVTIFDAEDICTASGGDTGVSATATDDVAALKANGAVSVSWSDVKITF